MSAAPTERERPERRTPSLLWFVGLLIWTYGLFTSDLDFGTYSMLVGMFILLDQKDR